jgi:hypothetical protein
MKFTAFAIMLFSLSFVQAQIEPKLHISCRGGLELRDYAVFGNELKINYYLNKKWSVEGKTFLPIKNNFEKRRYRFDGNKEFLLYNQTNVIAARHFFTGSLKTKSNGECQIEKSRNLGIRGGYFYYQNSFRNYWPDYYIIDSLPNGNVYGISGIKVHNLVLGIESNRFKRVKDKKTRIIRKQVYADVFLGFHHNVAGFIQVQNVYSPYSISEKYQLIKNGFGGRIGFQFSQTFKRKIGYYVGFEGAFMPTINYEENSNFHVPRAGRNINVIQISLKAGVTFFNTRK